MLTSDERELVLAKAIIIMMHMRNKGIGSNKTTTLALRLLIRIGEMDLRNNKEEILMKELEFLELEYDS